MIPPFAAALLVVVLGVVAFSAWEMRRRRATLLKAVRAAWGTPGPVRGLDDHGEEDAWLAMSADLAGPEAVDPRTWDDLDLDRVAGTVDRTRSGIGRQTLYRRLRSGAHWLDTPLLESAAERFSENPDLRDTCGLVLESAGRGLGPGLWAGIQPELHETRWWMWSFPALAMAMLVSLPAVPFEPRALLIALPLAAVNMAFCAFTAPRVGPMLPAVRQLGPLFRTAERLAAAEDGVLPGAAETRERLSRLRRIEGIAWWVSRDPVTSGELAAGLWTYLNLIFVLDANALLFGSREIRRRSADLVSIAEWIGDVDLARSVASLRGEPRAWCVPDVRDASDPTVGRGVWHPLIDRPVPNDAEVGAGMGMVITGANMAGKSTYLRTIGIAAVLARALHTVPAVSWTGPIVRVRSLMGRADQLAAGKSYYQVEVESVIHHLECAAQPLPTLFLLDELLRGTNTVERLAAGEAVLLFLLERQNGRPVPHRVMVATHDAELVHRRAGTYVPWHFRETLGASGLTFDYRRQPGAATTRTAIALLEASGAPAALVQTARLRAAVIEAK